ncbi:threonine ammonia-lyase IlvA [Sphingobacterium alkalisoli]|uniref:L-threonine dehydratase n=1 Tax=Sphingobacterium alkalisoli TaxID=1874115 RepID=A0A4U0HAC3_9SPHI|nr:threonine ammonia-lyase IlvA [Sphingobacterium alkalisoli]TJY68344.1 threonine ammonia-lyase IlvA [Sphingobacterium alkalisoli]GGH07161.1 L-threonine dehydratase biosynthetic IlvA [Sphingobacterium alkalisoli]
MDLSTLEIDSLAAKERIKDVVTRTPLQYNLHLSEKYGADVYLKREDLQVVRSYKLRGAYNKIVSISEEERSRGVVCASAGNHAQGVALSCKKLGIKGVIFMPGPTPRQKITQTEMWGNGHIEIVLTGDTFDDCQKAAMEYAAEHSMNFIPPFDDIKIIEGQGTVAVEIIEDLPDLDAILLPIGGGGLSSGVSFHMKKVAPHVKLYGIEPEGAPSMQAALAHGGPIELDHINKFVDGAAVKKIGALTYAISSQLLDSVKSVPEGKICTSILELYNKDAIVAEPAGALSIAALAFHQEEIRGKKVVCVVSGGNNDIDRMSEIKEMSLLYEGFKHYFIVRFPQRPGALRLLVTEVLGPKDDITRFEYIKKTERERGPALIGIELNDPKDYISFIERMKMYKFDFIEINKDQTLFEYLV